VRSIEQEPIAKGSVPELELRADDIVVDKQEVAYFRTKVTKYDLDPVLELALARPLRVPGRLTQTNDIYIFKGWCRRRACDACA
jgi:hypothetical protein